MSTLATYFVNPTGPWGVVTDHVLFIARASRGESTEAMNRIFNFTERATKGEYENTYGRIEGPFSIYVFARSSNFIMPRHFELITYITDLFRQIPQDSKLIIVTNGWDGITTRETSFLRLFTPDILPRIVFRVWADTPGDPSADRQFWQVDIPAVYRIFDGSEELEDESVLPAGLDRNTALFVNTFRALGAWKILRTDLGYASSD